MKPQPKIEQDVKTRLIDAAELLFAERGLEGVSLREIAIAAGQGNHSVVQYHFGDKENLVREIIAHRIAGFEPRREELLEKALSRKSGPDNKALLSVLLLPLMEQVDAEGRHVYARFMLQFLTHFRYSRDVRHPGWHTESSATRALALLGKRLNFLPPEDLYRRVSSVSSLMFSALVERDHKLAQGLKVQPRSHFLGDLFNMIAAAMEAPLPVRTV